jgi:glycosyltransferase involved in cell wall biosynthesis
MKISIISTCKSRLDHLKKVIDSWVNFLPHEIIVTDVSCPQKTADWLGTNYPQVKVVYQASESFNLSKARNLGAAAASGDWLFFVDADITLGSGFRSWIEEQAPNNRFLVREQKNAWDGIHEQGTVLCRKADFQKIEGYDEIIEGYGGEDHDLYYKLNRIGVARLNAPRHYIESLEHGDDERVLHYFEKDKRLHSVRARIYRAFKESILSNNKSIFEVPLVTRREIWDRCQVLVGENFDALSGGGPVEMKMQLKRWLPDPYYLSGEVSFKFQIRKAEG